MLNVTNWTVRLNELATEARVPGAALGIWADEGQLSLDTPVAEVPRTG